MPPQQSSLHSRLIGLGLLIFAPIVFFPACQTAGPSAPDILAEDTWARPSRPPMGMTPADSADAAPVRTSAVYLTLRNAGERPDTLFGATTDVARAVEIHESRMEGDVMRMRQVQSVEIPPDGSVVLRPGGLHIMLIGVARELAVGDQFGLTLQLAQSGERTVVVEVRQPE